MQAYIPIIVAVISAITVLFGYLFQKHREREFELNKVRQELYMRFVCNLTEKFDLFDKIHAHESIPERITRKDVASLMELVADKYPELDRNFKESVEIGALMSLYASDDAIKACSIFFRTGWESLNPDSDSRPDKHLLLHQLRKSLYRRTKVSIEDIRFITTK